MYEKYFQKRYSNNTNVPFDKSITLCTIFFFMFFTYSQLASVATAVKPHTPTIEFVHNFYIILHEYVQ